MTQQLIVGTHCHYLTGSTDGFHYKQEHLQFLRAGIITNYHPCRNMKLERMLFDGSLSHEQCWGARMYDVIDFQALGCEAREIVAPHPTKPINVGEHWFYLNVAGNILIKNCKANRIAGQFVQTVFDTRPNETSDYDRFKDAGGTIHVWACEGTDIGMCNPDHGPGGRASFPLSFFPSSQDVIVERTKIVNVGGDWWNNSKDPLKKKFKSFGGIMAHGHPNVTLEKNQIVLEDPDRDLVQIRNCENVVINGGSYMAAGGNGAKFNIDGCKHITISGVKSNARLRINGKDVGLVSSGWKQ